MRLLARFKYERDTNVWILILKNLHVLFKCLISNDEYFRKFSSFVKNLLSEVASKLCFDLSREEGKKFDKDQIELFKPDNVFFLIYKMTCKDSYMSILLLC